MSNEQRELRTAHGRYGYNGRIVVDKCPYCDKTHYHSLGDSRDDLVRLADCFRGEYKIVFTKEDE